MSSIDEELYPHLGDTDVATSVDEVEVGRVPCLRGLVYRRVSGAGWLHDGREAVTVAVPDGNVRAAFLRLSERLLSLFGVVLSETADPSRPMGDAS